MEQLFHTNKTAKDYKLPFLNPPKTSNRYDNVCAKVNSNSREDVCGNIASRLYAQKLEDEQGDRKNSVPPLVHRHTSTRKVEKSSDAMPRLKNKNTNKSQKGKHSKVPSIPNLEQNGSNGNEDGHVGIRHRSKGIQTVDSEDLDDLYSEGTIRYLSILFCVKFFNINVYLNRVVF